MVCISLVRQVEHGSVDRKSTLASTLARLDGR
jgi:hypothetical protein